MKKLTTLALAALMLAPATSFADSYEKVVTSGSELKTALNALGSGIAGETYTIICDWDATKVESVGKIKPTLTAGTLHLKSNQTDFEKMPQVVLAFEWAADGTRGEAGQNLSVIIENLNIHGSGSYLMDHRRAMFADLIALRNCNIHGQARSILRFDGDKHEGPIDDATGEKITRSQMNIDKIEVKGCQIHTTAQASGDNWSTFRTFMPVGEFVIEDNMFYDMPYTKSLWETRDVNEVGTMLHFNNNLVLLGQNKDLATTGFVMLNPAANVGPGSTFFINNNIIAAPRKGMHILVNDTTTYSNDTKLVSVDNAVVFATGNVIDTTAYVALDVLAESLSLQSTVLLPEENKVFGDYNVNWDLGQTFQNAEKDLYFMLKSNPWYTAGVVNPEMGANNTYVGPSIAYVDEFPTTVSINVKVNGPEYVTYTVSPEKEEYYKGDEVTISFNDHNSAYRTVVNFKGWSDDATLPADRTVVLTGDLDLTATFEPAIENVVSIFDFSTFTGNTNIDSVYTANIYSEEKYMAEAFMMVLDTTNAAVAPFNYIYGVPENTGASLQFAGRAAKFGEDDAEKQMPIITRRTNAAAHQAGQMNYALFKLCTKNLADVKFSCFVGTDNFMFAIQNLEYSLDGQTWVNFASVDMTDSKRDADFGGTAGYLYGWKELAGTLPAEANNLDVVYVRVISDPTSAALTNPAAGTIDVTTADTHEYIGQVLITGENMKIEYPANSWFCTPEYTVTPGQVEASVPGITVKFGSESETAAWGVNSYAAVFGDIEVTNNVGGNGGNPKSNGSNPSSTAAPTTGTYYEFTTTHAGKFTAYVVLNANKKLYLNDGAGNVLGGYDEYVTTEKFYGPLESVELEANKTYYLYCAGSKLGLIGFIYDSPEGVENVELAPATLDLNAPIFDLTGRQVANPVKGIYLQNGRKFIVK